MKVKKNKVIEELTQDIISNYNIQIPINNIDKVIEKLGGEVKESNNIEKLVKGRLKKENDNKFKIIIPIFKHKEDRTFAIAQELGHLFLHMGYQTNKKIWDKYKKNEYYDSDDVASELQANYFAMALLMPKYRYIERVNNTIVDGRINVMNIAEYFGVSISTAHTRGEIIGII